MWFWQELRTATGSGTVGGADRALPTAPGRQEQRAHAALRQMLIAAAIALALVGLWAALARIAV